MANRSIKGLVKIGKTTRDPELRAKELSQATGVAEPFYVAYSIEVDDCHSAEEYVHAILKGKGIAQSPNREFFEIPVRAAVEVLVSARQRLRAQRPQAALAGGCSDDDSAPQHPGAAIFGRAVEVYLGLGDEIADRKEGRRLFFDSKALNYPPAFTALAESFKSEAVSLATEGDHVGEQRALARAFDVLKEGARKGHGRCYVKMAELYQASGISGDPRRDPESAGKCRRKYFRSATFANDEDGTCRSGSLSINDAGLSRVAYARMYLFDVSLGLLPLDPEIREILVPLRAEILDDAKRIIDCLSGGDLAFLVTRQEDLESQVRFMRFIESVL